MELYPYMLTYGGPQLFVLFIFFVVTPFIYRRFLKQRERRIRTLSVLGLWITATAIAYGDVYLIAREARRLCRDEAGLRVYRTVEARGILGAANVREIKHLGITFVEWRTPMGRPTEREYYENGEYRREKISEFESEVELAQRDTRLTKWVAESKDLLIERGSNEIIAEIVAFKFYPGWMDSRLLGLIGLSWAPPRCDDDYPPRQEKQTHYISDLMRRAINPG